IEDLDELPIPDFSLSLSQGIAHNERMLIWLHRGCPYNCTYCMNHALRKIYEGKGKVIRVPSPERSIEIIKARISLPDNEGKAILFKDDTFSHDIGWLRVFCDLYKREIGLPWGAHLYPMMINEERIAIMKDAGCEVIETAIETGNPERRAKLLKRPMSDDLVIKAAKIVHRSGLCMRVQNILLLPGETFKTAWETLCLSIKCSADISTSTKFQPYPGLELTQSAIDMGHIKVGEFEGDIPLDFHWNSILDFKDKSELKRMRNLHHMFSFGVYFPIFKPLVWLLTFLPTSKFHYHIDNIAWRYITHRSAKFIKRGIWVKVLVFFMFLYNFCRYSKIRETLDRDYGEGVQRGDLEKVY
ncbi:radical SAM protein, partial [bacterium]